MLTARVCVLFEDKWALECYFVGLLLVGEGWKILAFWAGNVTPGMERDPNRVSQSLERNFGSVWNFALSLASPICICCLPSEELFCLERSQTALSICFCTVTFSILIVPIVYVAQSAPDNGTAQRQPKAMWILQTVAFLFRMHKGQVGKVGQLGHNRKATGTYET